MSIPRPTQRVTIEQRQMQILFGIASFISDISVLGSFEFIPYPTTYQEDPPHSFRMRT